MPIRIVTYGQMPRPVPISNMAATEADFCAARHEECSLVIPNKRRITQPRKKSASSLRAALKISPYGVAAFAKVVHISCMLRLVWRDFEQQLGSRLKWEALVSKQQVL